VAALPRDGCWGEVICAGLEARIREDPWGLEIRIIWLWINTYKYHF
jgi:hypothetical protein